MRLMRAKPRNPTLHIPHIQSHYPTFFTFNYLDALQLTDHIQHLLRDHDCVIIPDFGGLIADYEPARLHPVRHTLAPPAKRVAFNQALTRNDGLLVDAVSRHLHLTPSTARQQVRDAVQRMQQELEEQQRTELPGIGIFRQAPGRGLDFEYTGHQNLLPASFGLPELTSRPVRATDALQARERDHQAPSPQLAPTRRRTLNRLVNGVLGASIFGLLVAANLQGWHMAGKWPAGWWWPSIEAPTAASGPTTRPQTANLAQPWTEAGVPDGAPEATPEISKSAKVATAPKAAATPAAAPASVAAATKAAIEHKAVAKSGAKPAEAGGHYYVGIDSFGSMAQATQAQRNLARAGKETQVVKAGWHHGYFTKWHRLMAPGTFASQQQANASLPALRKQYGPNLVVYKY